MQLFRAQLSKYIPHPHRDSWMRNHLAEWLRLLRLGCFFTLLAAAYSIYKTYSPLGITDQFRPLLEQITTEIHGKLSSSIVSLTDLQQYLTYAFAGFFIIAALTSLRCGERKKTKYILPVFIASSLMVLAALEHFIRNNFEVIPIISYLLPIATPLLLLSYRRLANKIDHWNYYTTILCIITILGSALTYLFQPESSPQLNPSIFSYLGIAPQSVNAVMTAFSYTTIFFALLTLLATTRRLGLIALIIIGILNSIYRLLAHSLKSPLEIPVDLIITDNIFHLSYWLIPTLILTSLASRKKNQTLKI